jgi:endonuclease YncB( thermonuclease family)
MKNLLLHCYTFSIIFILFLVGCGRETQDQVVEQVIPYNPLPSRSTSPIEAGTWNVVRIVDGDTIIIGDNDDREQQHRVRLIGIDAPELARGNTPADPFAIDAMEFVKEKIDKAGNMVRLSFDGEELDRWRRTRAMVYVQIDGNEVWLNELLVRQGLAHARLDFRYSHEAKMHFALAEWQARKYKRNLWREKRE